MALTTPSMSPAIIVREFDLTGVAPNVETSLSGYVGRFKWGPVDVPTRIGNETQLAETFGIPDDTHASDYFSCNQFLRYSGNLIVNRAIPSTTGDAPYKALNAHSGSDSAPLVKNRSHFEDQSALEAGFVAKYPGEMGNSIAVHWFGVGNGDSAGSASHRNNFLNWDLEANFDDVPGTSLWAALQPGTAKHDEIHLAIVDSDGLISGTKGTVLETYAYLSVAKGAKTADGGDNYIDTVINDGSRYVWFTGWDSAIPSGTNWGLAPLSQTERNYADGFVFNDSSAESKISLNGGQDHSLLTTGDYISGFDPFRDVEEIDVQMLIAPDGYRTTGSETETQAHRTLVNELTSIASAERKDCLVVASPPRNAIVGKDAATAVDNTISWVRNGLSDNSYLTVDNNYLRVYDKYNDNYINIPAASTTAGIMALTDYEYGPWWSPAGERRGEYIGITNLAYSPSKAQRDELYKNSVNPIVQFPGRGTILFGDKTRLTRPSAFDRINVRRLFLAIEKSISEAARNFLFEFNDEFTRSEFVAIVEPLLREVQARRGIQDFFVQCDERNNTPEVIDRNELIASIFIKPARSINFITINFVATRTGADFEEIIQSGIQF
jgi:hypothetical protein